MKKIKGIIFKILYSLKWKNMSNKIRREEKHLIESKKSFHINNRILIVSPHPDDELIGCFEVIKKYSNYVDIYYSGLTGYDTSLENQKIRKSELQDLCNFYNLNFMCDKYGEDIVLNGIDFNNYDYVFLPSYIDWHFEHRKLCLDVLNILYSKKSNCKICFYMVSVPFTSRIINCYNIVSKEKWKTFDKIYKSQSYMPINRFKCCEKSYLSKDKKRIEPYYCIENSMIKKYIDIVKTINTDELDGLKKFINDIYTIRKNVDKYYKEFYKL